MNLKKDALYNTIGNIVYLGCQWIITVMVTRICGYEEAGILSVAMTSVNIFFVIAGYGMRSFQASDITQIYSNAQYLGSRYFTVFIGAITCILFIFVSSYSAKQSLAIFLFLLYKLLEAISDVLYGILQAEGKLKFAGYSLCIKGIAGVAVFFFPLLLTKNLNFALTIFVISGLIGLLAYDVPHVVGYKQSSLAIRTQDFRQIRKLLIQCFPMFVVSVSPMILQAIPKLALERMVSTEQLGVYSSVAAPTVIISTLVSSIIIPFLPLFSHYISQHDLHSLRKLLLRSLGLTFLLGILGVAASLLLGKFFLGLIFGRSILPYAPLLTYIILMMTFSAGLMSFNSLFIAGRKLIPLAINYVLTNLLCAVLTPFFIQVRALYGVVDVLLLVQVIQMISLAIMSLFLFFRVQGETDVNGKGK